jgi:hypothetical protein
MESATPPTAASPQETGWSPLVAALSVVASIAVLVAVWIVDYLPTHDGPQHLLLGHLENHFGDPGAGFDRFLQPGFQVTEFGFNVVFAPLEQLFSWRTALRLTLSLDVLVWGWGYTALVAAIDRRRAALGLLGFASALCWELYMGFLPFVFATGLGFAVIAAGLARWPWRLRERLGLSAMLLIVAFAHVFCALAAGLVLGCVVLARSDGRERARELGRLLLVSLPTLAVAALTASPPAATERDRMAFVDHLSMIGRTFVSGPAWRSWPVILLAALGLWSVATRARRGEATRTELGAGVAAALLLAAALIAPIHLGGWDFFFPRFVPVGALLAAALVPVERLASRPRRLAAVAALAAFALASSAWAAGYHRSLRGRVAEAISGLDEPLHRTGPRLSLVLDPYAGLTEERTGGAADWNDAPVPFAAPLYNLGALYAVAQGGVPSWIFASRPRLHPFFFSPEGQRLYPGVHDPIQIHDPRITGDPAARRKLLTWLATVGAPFEDVILSGQPADGDLFVQRGYLADFRRGGLFLGHFEGCPVRVEITAPSPLPRALAIDYGFSGMPEAPNAFLIPKGTAAPEGRFTVTPRKPLCGDAWLRAALVDEGAERAAPQFCAGASRDGRIRVQATRDAHVVACRVGE